MISKILNKLLHINKPIKRFWFRRWNYHKFRMLGIKIGKGASMWGKVYIHTSPSSKVVIGHHFAIRSGDNFNPLCSNLYCSIEVANGAKLAIGDYCGMSGGCMWVTDSISIGNHVNIGANCMLLDGDIHSLDWQIRRDEHIGIGKSDFKHKPITIEDDVWIGANSIILKGVTIGRHSIIGAGSVVTKSVPPDCIAAGNPCKIIKRI